MNYTITMSESKKLLSKKQKLKQMSKAQIQLNIIKKKQCDAKALVIVEQLLELNVNVHWLLQNLGFISKSHMEDVIEERAIVKLCGYVLCSKPLTVIIQQQYHISTRKNKVYDVSKRKNFCSSSCYGAANYLLEQMLESPLWLREKEDIPVFQILPINLRSTQIIPGDEIDVSGINVVQNRNADSIDDNKESIEHSKHKRRDISDFKEKDIHSDIITKENVEMKEISINTDLNELPNSKTYSSELSEKGENKTYDTQESISHENSNNNIQEINVNLKNLEIGQSKNISHLHEDNIDTKNKNTNAGMCNIENSKMLQSNKLENSQTDSSNLLQSLQSQFNKMTDDQSADKKSQSEGINNEDNGSEKLNRDNIERVIQPQLDEMCSSNSIISSVLSKEIRKKRDANKNKKCKQKEFGNAEVQANIYHKVAMHIEQSVQEWVTENTLCLLMGEEDEKYQLLESLTQHDRYQQLCKKLNRLQLEDEKEDRVNLEKNVLKPLPHFSVIQEEAKKIELKVRAFYEGRVTITSEDNNKDSENKDDGDPILPLTDSHAPNALRRRIFLDKLNKILPDLLRALTANMNTSLVVQCTYNNERYSLTKILVSTFNLTAANIVFKTAEWTLVGLIIIKMLSLIDTQLQLLLRSKQAAMYTSMILMSYKLDSNYLDRLIMEVTNNMDVRDVNNK